MKHWRWISAAAVAVAAVSVTLRSGDPARENVDAVESISNPADTGRNTGAGPQATGTRDRHTALRSADARRPPNERAGWRDPSGTLGISPAFLEQARERVANLEEELNVGFSATEASEYADRTVAGGNPARLISLRLEADEELAARIGEIVDAGRADHVARRIERERGRMRALKQWIDADRDSYTNYVALRTMADGGVPLSDAQRGFLDEHGARAEELETTTAEEVEVPWHEDSELLAKIDELLTPDQRRTLADHVQERNAREEERRGAQASMRSGAIADRLGLSEEERSLLHDFLRQNPGAGTAELSQVLAPELRELLAPGM